MAVNHDGFLEILDQTDQKHTDAHQRLRTDFRELETRLDEAMKLLGEAHGANRAKLAELAATPVDMTKLVLRTPVVVSIILVICSIVGGMWASTSGLRSNIDKVVIQMEAASALAAERAQRVADNNGVIKDALATNSRDLKEQISLITKRQELQQLQIQQMQESIIRLTPQGRR